jgi:L-iditol 2-dehydrogenase
MKSLLLSQIDQIKVVDLATPEIAADKSVIKVLACGLCGTDRHIYKGEYPSAKPVILGHEFGGVIETPATGSKFSKGDLVSVDPNIVCGTCIDCQFGRTAFCAKLTALGVNINGGLAEYVLTPDVVKEYKERMLDWLNRILGQQISVPQIYIREDVLAVA